MSNKNAVRSPNLAPTPGPSSLEPQRPSSPPLPPLPADESTPSAHAQPSNDHRFPTPLEDDLPPAYTPAADPTLGEATLELGPRRPFQPPPTHPTLTPNPTGSAFTPPSVSPPWHQSPGQAYYSGAFSPSSSAVRPQQPNGPQHHTWHSSHMYSTSFGNPRTRSQGGGGLIGALIDGVRDVVDVISGAHDDRLLAEQRASAGAYAPPNHPAQRQYAPPVVISSSPSPPPRSQVTNSSTRSPTSTVPDDGSPTRTPVPGHPLLRDGMLLVYPKDHHCPKCRNTGYKDYDPSHPCRKCWDKYAKPYTGALTYTPWSSSATDASTSRMQRPLPRTLQRATSNPCSPRMGCIVPPPQPSTSHTRSVSQPNLPLQPQPTGTGPTYYLHNPVLGVGMTAPVPHAIPVSPGDPRLGGRICHKCAGSGMKLQMLFDLTTCRVCGGVGRIWT